MPEQGNWYDDINSNGGPEFLLALSKGNDPFYSPHPPRQRLAGWFAELWNSLGFKERRNVHLRRVHYILVSQHPPIILPNDKPYENTEGCWSLLLGAGRDARYLNLIPREAIIDARNPEVECHLITGQAASTELSEGGTLHGISTSLPGQPRLRLTAPVIPQRYHIEIWAEKSTQNDILRPLARAFKLNLFAGAGEVSLTRCDELITRAKSSERPVRILYISDFDPAGESMPITAARKIEYAIRNRHPDLDIQVRNIALTLDQCNQFNLPRTPIKPSEKRRDTFEEKYGRGATELDALEALHPGSLREIVVAEIERYYDRTLEGRMQARVEKVRARLGQANDDVRDKWVGELEAIEEELARLAEEYNERLLPLRRRFQSIQEAIEAELNDFNVAGEEWPKATNGNEDDNPLFDSRRDYSDQVVRFKRQQGKPASSKEYVPISIVDIVEGITGKPRSRLVRRL